MKAGGLAFHEFSVKELRASYEIMHRLLNIMTGFGGGVDTTLGASCV